MGKVDEFNSYGINNPDGVQHGYTDYKKWSFDNDTKLASVKELPTAKVKEYSSYNEYPAVRQKDAPNNRNVKVDNTQAQQKIQDVANQQAAATQTAASTATATTQVAAASTTTMSVAVASGTVATTIATIAVVATVVVNAFVFAINFISATFNSLAFEVSIENNEDNEEFRAVLYDDQDVIVKELTISNSQIVVFEDLQEGKEYTFVVYDKDEIVKFKQTYLTSTRKAYEDQISIEITSKESGKVSFNLYVPQDLAKEVYTLRVSDEKGKELYAVDGSQATSSYTVSIPDDRDIFFAVSFRNRVAYQYKVAKSIKYNDPTYDWANMKDNKVVATFVAQNDPTNIKTVEVPVTANILEQATMKTNGLQNVSVDFDFEGKNYKETTQLTIPALIYNYEFTRYEWVDNGLEKPTANIVLTNKTDGSVYKEAATVTLSSENVVDMVYTGAYNAAYSVLDLSYPDSHDVVLNDFAMEIMEIYPKDINTGLVMAQMGIMYEGLDEAVIEYPTFLPTIERSTEEGVFYDMSYRGQAQDYIYQAWNSDRLFYIENYMGYDYVYQIEYEDLDVFEVTFKGLYASVAEFTIPETIFGFSVTKIGESAFSDLEEEVAITVPASVTHFDGAFSGAQYVHDITFEGTLTTVAQNMFNGTGISPNAFLQQHTSITRIEDGAFAFAKNGNAPNDYDTTLTIPDNIQYIGQAAFAGQVGLVDITIPFTGSSANATGEAALFGYIFGNTTGSGVVDCSQSFYNETTSSESQRMFSIPSNLQHIYYTGTTLKEYAFSGIGSAASGLYFEFEADYISDGVIPKAAFRDSTVTSFNVSSSGIYTIEAQAFKGADQLSTYMEGDEGELSFDYSVEEIGAEAFASTSFSRIIIGSNVETIGKGAFATMASLEYYESPFVGGLSNVDSSAEKTAPTYFGYVFAGGASGTYSATHTQLDDTDEDITAYFDNQIEFVLTGGPVIEAYAFANNNVITKVTLPDSVMNIREHAFDYCSELTEVEYADVDALELIGECAFQGTKLSSFTIGSSLQKIGAYALNIGTGFTTYTTTATEIDGMMWYSSDNPSEPTLTLDSLKGSGLSSWSDRTLWREDFDNS